VRPAVVRLSAAGEGGSKVIPTKPQALFSTFRTIPQTFSKIQQYQHPNQTTSATKNKQTNKPSSQTTITDTYPQTRPKTHPRLTTQQTKNPRIPRRYHVCIAAISQRWADKAGKVTFQKA
ncbi:hypothetical protein, partial [Shimia sagamensis]|uniref:hypothetical protein n=1 Tax=Shimia sagamensis TaxID=1566352 RepID=UPI0024B787B6